MTGFVRSHHIIDSINVLFFVLQLLTDKNASVFNILWYAMSIKVPFCHQTTITKNKYIDWEYIKVINSIARLNGQSEYESNLNLLCKHYVLLAYCVYNYKMCNFDSNYKYINIFWHNCAPTCQSSKVSQKVTQNDILEYILIPQLRVVQFEGSDWLSALCSYIRVWENTQIQSI